MLDTNPQRGKGHGKAAYSISQREEMMEFARYYDMRMIIYLFSPGGFALNGLIMFLVLL